MQEITNILHTLETVGFYSYALLILVYFKFPQFAAANNIAFKKELKMFIPVFIFLFCRLNFFHF